MSAVTKLLGIFGLIILAQCLAIFLVEQFGAFAIFATIPIGVVCGISVCNLIGKE